MVDSTEVSRHVGYKTRILKPSARLHRIAHTPTGKCDDPGCLQAVHVTRKVAPFIGLIGILIDVPVWLQIVIVGAVIVCMFFGTKLLFRTKGGWRPSQTLPEPPARPR